ncbi:MAG: GNAT family N-acetyltransferase [Weeksellaceae bacterium]|nr:GNAT family N-acetyltransferase [Weeksellaceae bacterium]
MKNLIIRQAIPEDCLAMLDLIKELAAYEKAPEEVTVTLQEFVDAGFGSQPVWGAFVAEREDEIVGLSLYYVRYSTWKGQRLYLEDLIVTEKLRGNGIGKSLFDKTLDYAKSKNYSGIVFQVLNWNEPAINFYKKYETKFDDEWINVSIELN